LKIIKTAKEMFGKIWRKQAKICENLPKKLGKFDLPATTRRVDPRLR